MEKESTEGRLTSVQGINFFIITIRILYYMYIDEDLIVCASLYENSGFWTAL